MQSQLLCNLECIWIKTFFSHLVHEFSWKLFSKASLVLIFVIWWKILWDSFSVLHFTTWKFLNVPAQRITLLGFYLVKRIGQSLSSYCWAINTFVKQMRNVHFIDKRTFSRYISLLLFYIFKITIFSSPLCLCINFTII